MDVATREQELEVWTWIAPSLHRRNWKKLWTGSSAVWIEEGPPRPVWERVRERDRRARYKRAEW